MQVTYIDPQIGGYEELNGSLVTTHPTVNKVNRLLLQKIGQDLMNSQSGNPLITTKNLTLNDVVNGVNYALSPLTSTGEISDLIINEVKKTARGRWSVKLIIVLPNQNEPETVTWEQPFTR